MNRIVINTDFIYKLVLQNNHPFNNNSIIYNNNLKISNISKIFEYIYALNNKYIGKRYDTNYEEYKRLLIRNLITNSPLYEIFFNLKSNMRNIEDKKIKFLRDFRYE